MWCRAGRPRYENDSDYINYKNAKRIFRRMHRYGVEIYLNLLNQDLDKNVEIDADKFWKVVKSRKQKSVSKIGAGIKFQYQVVWDRKQLTEEWGHYFKSLYSPSDSSAAVYGRSYLQCKGDFR